MKRILLAWLVCLPLACASGVEPRDVALDAARARGDVPAPATSTVQLQYQVAVDPRAAQINFEPQETTALLTSYLNQSIAFSAVEISNGTTSVYDLGSNTLRLAGSGNTGLCLKNAIGTSQHMLGVTLRFSAFTKSGVVPGSGAVSLGNGTYSLAFGDIKFKDTVCRAFSLTDTDGVAYRFQLTIDGTLSSSAPTTYINSVSSTLWSLNDNITIDGTNISGGSSQVCITPDPSEKTFCNSGVIIAPDLAAFTTDTPTQLGFTTNDLMTGLEGYLIVNNGDGNTIVGPYVEWTSSLQFNLALPSSSATANLLFLTWDGSQGLNTTTWCPPTVALNDAEILNNVALSTTPAAFNMEFLNATGPNKNVAVLMDINRNGIADTGDYIEIIPHADLRTDEATKPVNLAQMFFGSSHSCGISTGGALYCWGPNAHGEIGDGTQIQRLNPTLVPSLSSGVSAVFLGNDTTCAIHNGAAKCWGINSSGQLGDGTTTDRFTPTQVSGLTSNVTNVSIGPYHTCAVHNGAAKCWGDNLFGQLGNGTTTASLTPTAVSGLSSGVTGISAGEYYTCAIVNGAVKCWGFNFFGQLGDGTTTDRNSPTATSGMSSGVTAIVTSQGFSCAIQNNAAKCWGANYQGELGDGTTTNRTTPVAVSGLSSDVRMISTGRYSHACAIHGEAAKCWGSNAYSQLGDGTTTDRSTPVTVVGLETNATAVRAGSQYSCGIVGNSMKCWGSNERGSLGTGESLNHNDPVSVSSMTSSATAVAAGSSHGCGIVSGALKCWGANQGMQLGDGTTTDRATPVQVSGLTAGVTESATGNNFSCAIASGSAKCWGYNVNGQLGDNTLTNRSTPVQVSGLTSGVSGITTGHWHSCAIDSAGAAKCWGANFYGQLGDNTSARKATPTQVSGLTANVTMLAAGADHTCAVHNGAAKCWGRNDVGQLGDATTTQRLVPVQVSGLTSGVSAVSTSRSNGTNIQHSCAIHNGAAKCWGDNSYRQLGDGTTTRRTAPVQVTGLTSGVTAIATGQQYTCAIHNGALKCWGDNTYGIYADGTNVSSTGIVSSTSLTSGLTSLSAYATFACAVRSAGVVCWGSSVNVPMLGDGAPLYQTSPSPLSVALTFSGADLIPTHQITATCP